MMKFKETRNEERLLGVLDEVQRDGLDEIYARYSNRLSVEADNGNDEEEYQFLLEAVEMLRGIIVQRYMKERCWCLNEQDTFRRWERE